MIKRFLISTSVGFLLGGGFWFFFGTTNHTGGSVDGVVLSNYDTVSEQDIIIEDDDSTTSSSGTTSDGDILSNYTIMSGGDISLHYDNTLSGYKPVLITGVSSSYTITGIIATGIIASGVAPNTLVGALDDISSTTQYIYRVTTVLEHLPFVTKKVDPLLVASHEILHGSADEQSVMYEIDQDTINGLLMESQSFSQFYRKLRINILQFMIDRGYTDFDNQPYQKYGNMAIVAQSGDFHIFKNIETRDALDDLLAIKLTGFQDNFADIQRYSTYLEFKPVTISTDEYAQLSNLFLFKNEQDLRDLGYELISWKTRTNTDPDYRRHNISAAFYNIGNVRLILPNEIFSLAHEFHYSASDGKLNYMDGYATLGGTSKKIYGGGLCGVATALFQGSLTNIGLPLIEYKAHTIYYRNLYEAEIDGITITQPGLDATIYSPDIDFQLQNIREYPIIVVFNYDGQLGTTEQVFTLSKAQDKGTFSFVGEYRRGGSKCFTRDINGEKLTNCYSKVVDF